MWSEDKQTGFGKIVQCVVVVLVFVLFFDASGCTAASASDPSLLVKSTLQLQEDRRVEGDLMMTGGMLDLNGCTLTVTGSFFHQAGDVNVKGGSLIVLGDYRIQGAPIENGASAKNSQGRLTMNNENDVVRVHGDFVMQSAYHHAGRLMKGVLEVKGNFVQKAGAGNNFSASGTHKVVLSGEKRQNVSFENPEESGFSLCEIRNDRVFFLTAVKGWKLESDAVFNVPEGKVFPGFTGTANLNGKSLTVKGSLVSEQNNTLNLTKGKLVVEGDFLQPFGEVNVKGGSLIVLGDYKIQGSSAENSQGRLTMSDENDSVSVHGDFVMQSAHPHVGRFSKGVLEVKGNFVQKAGAGNNFSASGTHKVVLSGEKRQNVSFENPDKSGFQMLLILNRDKRGIGAPAGYKVRREHALVLDRTYLRLNPGETVRVKISGGPDERFSWSSLDEKVASVSEGAVRAKAPGRTRIRIAGSADQSVFLYIHVEVAQKESSPLNGDAGDRSAGRPPVPKETARERAMRLVHEAIAAQKEGRLEEALQKYKESLVIYHSPKVAEHVEKLEKYIRSHTVVPTPAPTPADRPERPESPPADVSDDDPTGDDPGAAQPGTITIRAIDIVRGCDVAPASGVTAIYGQGVLINAPPYTERPNCAEYSFIAPSSGNYRLEIEYAAAQSRPVQVTLNGVLVNQSAIAQITGGWMPENQRWTEVGTYRLKKGSNSLLLERKAVFPCIRALRWTPVDIDPQPPEVPVSDEPPRVRAMELVYQGVAAQKDGRLEEALRKFRESLGIYHIQEVAEHVEQLEKSFQSRK